MIIEVRILIRNKREGGSEIMSSLGERIRALRLKKNLTQEYISNQLGMGRSNFGHIEHDRVIPSAEDLRKIADILDTSTDYLLGRVTTYYDHSSSIKKWIKYNHPELNDKEINDLCEELEDFLLIRKRRIVQKRVGR